MKRSALVFATTLIYSTISLADTLVAPCPNAGPEGCPKGELQTLVADEKPNGPPLSGDALEQRTQTVAADIRCPVCQGSSIADSPSEMARNMKSSVRDLLALGYDDQQVMRIFERAYGEFIRLEPVADGFNLVVWIGPIVLLLLGLFVVWRVVRPVPAGATNAPATAETGADAIDPELQKYLEQARALARHDGPTGGGN